MNKSLLLGLLLVVACGRATTPDLSDVAPDGSNHDDARSATMPRASAMFVPQMAAAFTPTPGCCPASSTGSATSANQSTEIGLLTTIATNTGGGSPGSATAANQVLQLAQETAISGKLPTALVGGRLDVNIGAATTLICTGPLTDTQLRASAVPVSMAAVPTGGSTAALQTSGNASLATIATNIPAVGQAAMAASSPVVIASNQTAIPVSGAFWQATQPISAAALPLMAGAATSAKQPALGTAGTASSDVITIQGIAGATAVKTDSSATTQPISAAGSSWTYISAAGTSNIKASAAILRSVQVLKSNGGAVLSCYNANAGTTNKMFEVDTSLTGAYQLGPFGAAASNGLTCIQGSGAGSVSAVIIWD